MHSRRILAIVASIAFVLDVPAQDTKKPTAPAPAPSRGHAMAERTTPLSPADAAKAFVVPDDLEIEPVLTEPIVRQPVFLNFDERGRMWVVQYLQYPAPAGLKVVSKDVFWRAVYDKVPEPPPRGVKGLDKITIHEDTDGDGVFDKHKTFVDGLNIATACVKGRGGVWVLNPPYLLFYPDKDNDDVPDGDPIVHLEGFGLEDTHSVVNSLRWGPDGWLYAAQGSTVTANVRVRVPSSLQHSNTPSIYSQGQNIWRYHPERHVYEVFAEGGGNAFGVEMDPEGRIFSGHNGGDTRGFHYMQGAYLRKGFEKHGELSNPYAFGYFPQMDGTKGERFTHNFILYHGGTLPARYVGKLFGIEPLQGRVVLSDVTPDGSTFKTRDLERVVTSHDSWFRPVDIKVGPDGAIYIADWYDRQVTHTRNQEGNIDTSNGRIYRLRAKPGSSLEDKLAPDLVKRGFTPEQAERAVRRFVERTRKRTWNLRESKNEDLLDTFQSEMQWHRDMARQVLVERHDPAVIPPLLDLLSTGKDPQALEALWTLHQLGHPISESLLIRLTRRPRPHTLAWAIRLLGDQNKLPSGLPAVLANLAASQTNLDVRTQLACTAKRLPAQDALPIVANLLRHDEDARDPRLPLLCWWAIESKCESDRAAVLKLFEDSPFWTEPMVEQHILDQLMRRFAAAGSRQDLLTCARLLELSPSREHSTKLMAGFEAAFKGRSLAGLPDELITALGRHNVGSVALRIRRGDPEAAAQALVTIADAKADVEIRRHFVEILGEVRPAGALDSLLRIADTDPSPALRIAALTALLRYDDPRIGAMVAKDFNAYSPEVRTAALTLCTSRAAWSLALVRSIDAGQISARSVPMEFVRKIKLHKGDELGRLANKHWPQSGVATTAVMQQQIDRLAKVLRTGEGDPYQGQKLFNTACASCHTLFARGGKVGPDLTSYQRNDLNAMLLHVVNPSAEIREGYENFLIETKDERSLNGFLVERDAKLVVLRGADGQNITIDRSEIAEMRAAGASLMPEGLLEPLSDEQVRDLFAYLRSTQPLAN